jgi:hypothetical protein
LSAFSLAIGIALPASVASATGGDNAFPFRSTSRHTAGPENQGDNVARVAGTVKKNKTSFRHADVRIAMQSR